MSVQSLFAGSVLPSYHGRGISSIPATILEAFGGRLEGHPRLDDDVLPPSFFDGITTVVLILVDGMGLHRYRRTLDMFPDLAMGSLARRGVEAELTSVLPSTTTAALATLSTGLTPHEHGLVGYKLFLRELNETANMIRFSPVNKHQAYARKRINPQNFFDHTTLYQRLHEIGASSRVIIKAPYVHSPMSRMFYRGAEVVGHAGTHDAFVILRRMLEQRDGSPSLIYLYWDPVDNVSHFVGPDADEVTAEITGFDYALRRHVLDLVKARDVAVLITADHGQVYTQPSQRLKFNSCPPLLNLLERPPSGDSRLPYLQVKEGAMDEARALALEAFGEAAAWHETEDLLREGWFGIGDIHAEARSRLGNAVMDVRSGYKISYHYSEDELESIGCHGALDREEMMVPLIAARLD